MILKYQPKEKKFEVSDVMKGFCSVISETGFKRPNTRKDSYNFLPVCVNSSTAFDIQLMNKFYGAPIYEQEEEPVNLPTLSTS
jgi:hypothetical protein